VSDLPTDETTSVTDLDRLLDVQDHDTRLDQLRHKRAALPERPQLADLEQAMAVLDDEVDRVAGERDALAREQKRIEDEVATVEAKAAEVHGTLYGGTVTSPRALQDLQADLESLQRRQRTLEDEVLELMEQQEAPTDELDRLSAQRGEQQQAAEQLRAAITAQEAEIDVEIDTVQAERDALAAGVADALLAEYERLRGPLGGIGVARLEGGRCLGCQLLLSAVERDRIKSLPPDALLHCEECGRLLVH
jgi:predicted  nucleic acid-binding Zn-ribbon protein